MVMFADVATVILMSFADVISMLMLADVAPFPATGCRSDSQSRRCALMMEQQQDLHAVPRNGFLSLGKMDLRAHLSNGFVWRRGAVKNDGSSEGEKKRRGWFHGSGFRFSLSNSKQGNPSVHDIGWFYPLVTTTSTVVPTLLQQGLIGI